MTYDIQKWINKGQWLLGKIGKPHKQSSYGKVSEAKWKHEKPNWREEKPWPQEFSLGVEIEQVQKPEPSIWKFGRPWLKM